MSDEKWDKLPYLLKTAAGERSLVLLSNFELTENRCFYTGLYKVTEHGITLGDIPSTCTATAVFDGMVNRLNSRRSKSRRS
jgi:hypothetical protein